jgi:3-hydroxybutyryl-CoA dehydrogenase
MTETSKVIVVGAGIMGAGIAQVCAQSGLQVFFNDIDEQALGKALERIDWSLGKLAAAGRLSEQKETILSRIRLSPDLSVAADAHIAIEAVYEKLDLKQNIFRDIDQSCGPRTILASNTSAIPITELASVTRRPDKVVGLHFFNPVAMIQVVEVIKGIETSENTMESSIDFVISLGKEAIRVESDIPGFLLNRINLVSYVEAIRLVEQGLAKIPEIDKGVRLAFGRKQGPFETGDMVGLDVSYGALMAIYEESKDPRYYPPQLLRRKVKAGYLGRKTGKGWYDYDAGGNRKLDLG